MGAINRTTLKVCGSALRGALLAICGMLACHANAASKNAGIKCWTNRDGVRECGNAVPPEYAQQGHEVKSESGMTIGKQSPAKTREQVARERAEREIAARRQAEAEEIARRQAAADKVLLDTFSTEEDLILARDGQIANLESQVKLTEGHIAKLQKSMDDMISRAADFERRSKPVPAKLTRNIESVQQQIAENRAFIANKQVEQAAIKQKFEADLIRFRELRSAQR